MERENLATDGTEIEASGAGQDGASRRRERAVLLTLGAVQFTSIVDFMVVMPLGPQLMRTLHLTPAQFGLIVMPVLIIMNLLSGSTTPMESMPNWLQKVMQFSPSTHFVALSQAVLYRGAGLAIIWPQMLALAGIGVAFFAIAGLRFRKSLLNVQR